MIRAIEPRPASQSPQEVMVCLTVPSYQANRTTVDWQRAGRNYRYWTNAGPAGASFLRGVRPGTFVLKQMLNLFPRGLINRHALETGVEAMVFITTNTVWCPRSECDLYRRRWDIGVSFSQFKQNLKPGSFPGHSANAASGQVDTALLVYWLQWFMARLTAWGAQPHPVVCRHSFGVMGASGCPRLAW